MTSVIAMSNKIPKRPKITYHVNYLESRRKARAHDKKYKEPKSFPSKPLKPYVDFAAPAGQTFAKSAKETGKVFIGDYTKDKGKIKKASHLLSLVNTKNKNKNVDHRKKGPR